MDDAWLAKITRNAKSNILIDAKVGYQYHDENRHKKQDIVFFF